MIVILIHKTNILAKIIRLSTTDFQNFLITSRKFLFEEVFRDGTVTHKKIYDMKHTKKFNKLRSFGTLMIYMIENI